MPPPCSQRRTTRYTASQHRIYLAVTVGKVVDDCVTPSVAHGAVHVAK